MVQQIRGTGFTLFELLVVLIVIGLITSLVGPRLIKSMNRRNIDSTARQISAALRYARSGAVSEKTPYRARFDMDADRLTIERFRSSEEEDPSDRAVSPYGEPRAYTLAPGIHFKKGLSLSGETIDAGAFEIVFFPAGGTSGGEIILTDEEKRSFSISVDMITGSVTVNQGGSSHG